jgi:hypothetical protein
MTRFSLAQTDPALPEFMDRASTRTLAMWALECTERVMPHFEKMFHEDRRPRQALDTLRAWIATGEFKMAVIRRAALDAHAAARAVGEDNAARSAARAAGQAVATAHVKSHAKGAANYAVQAVHRASDPAAANTAAAAERAWQRARLHDLIENARLFRGEAHSAAPG